MADIAIFRINYKSDFILTLNSDAGWMTPFCIKFWTGVPSRAYFVGWDGKEYINCKVDKTDASKLIVLFDDHQLPVGQLKMQMAWHTTIEEFPGSKYDYVTNARDVIVDIEGTEHQVMLDVNGETAPEIEFNLPAYEAEAERQRAEQQRQTNEQARNAAETIREQAESRRQRDTGTAIQKAKQATLEAENVNARLSSDGGVVMLTITNRQGNQTSKEVGFRIAKTYPNVAAMNADLAEVEEGRFVMIAGSTEDVDTGKLYVRGASAFTFITDLSGAQGIKGDTGNGIASVTLNADYTLTIVFTDGTSTTTTSIRGAKGDPGTTDYNELVNKPDLAEVATSGSYNDLKNKPEIDTPKKLFYPNNTTAIDSETGPFQGSEFFRFRLRSGSLGWKILNSEWSENDQFPCKLSLQAAPDRELIRWDGFGGTDNSNTVFKLKAGFYGGDYIISATANNEHKLSIADGLGHKILTSTMESVDFFLQNGEKFFEIGRNSSGEYAHFTATTGLKFDRVYDKTEQKGTFYLGLKDRFVLFDSTDADYGNINSDTDPEVRLVYNHSSGLKAYNNLLMMGYNLRGYPTRYSGERSWEISAAGNFKLFTGSLTLGLGDVNIENGSLVFGTLYEKGFVKYDANNARFVLEHTIMGPDGLVTIPADIAGYYTSQQTDSVITQALNAALANYTTTNALTLLLAGKQDVISDLAEIRSGAAAGAAAYQKPQGGIPSTEMSQDVQASLEKANTALQNHQDISGKEDVTTIVAPVNETDATQPITTLSCQLGKYYRIDVPVETLAVTLPAMENITTTKTVVLYLTGGTTPAVTISSTAPTGGGAPDVLYQDGYAIESGKTYEVNCLWNGLAWIVASVEIVVTNNGGE